MANTPEGKVKSAIAVALKDFDVSVVNPMGGYHGNNSVSDGIWCHHGLYYGVEVKATYPFPTEAQLEHLRGIYENGGVVACIGGKGVSTRMSKKHGIPIGTIAWWSHKSIAAQWTLSVLPVSNLVAPHLAVMTQAEEVKAATKSILTRSVLGVKLVWGREPALHRLDEVENLARVF